MPDQKQAYGNNTLENKGRRKAIKKIVIGVGALATYNALPERWTRPIIDQIVVPVHAATSGIALHDPCSITLVFGDQASPVQIRVDGYVTPPTSNLPATVVATSNAGVSFTVNTTTGAGGTFQAIFNYPAPRPVTTSIAVTLTVTGAAGTAKCSIGVPIPEVTTSRPTTTPTTTALPMTTPDPPIILP